MCCRFWLLLVSLLLLVSPPVGYGIYRVAKREMSTQVGAAG